MNNYIDYTIEQRKLAIKYHFVIEDQKRSKIIRSTILENHVPEDSRDSWSWLDIAY